MKAFRTFMIIYICSCFITEFILLLWKPVRIFPYSIYYSTGLLFPISSFVSGILFGTLITAIGSLAEFLWIIVLERHFQIIKITAEKRRLRIILYCCNILTFSYVFVSVIILCLNNIKKQENAENLLKDVTNIQIFLDTNPSFYVSENTWNYAIISILLAVSAFLFYRYILIFWLLYQNFYYSKHSQIILSTQSKKQFNLMFQTTVTQLITFLIFGLPCAYWIISLIIPSLPPIFHNFNFYVSSMTCFYPIFDVLIVISVVGTYRKTTVQIFRGNFSFLRNKILSDSNVLNAQNVRAHK